MAKVSLKSQLEFDAISRVLSGDKEAFREIVTTHYGRIYALCFKQTGRKEVAEDITQEIFIRAYKSLSSFEGRSSFITWLTRIALNLMNNYYSSKQYREWKTTKLLDSKSVELELEQSALENYHDNKMLERLRDILPELPEHYREVLQLCAFARFSYNETAELLSIPAGTVASRMNKAICLLKDQFKKDTYEQ